MWRDLVPTEGPAPTLQGELIRAHGRIGIDLYRNGMMNWGPYYKELLGLINSTLSNASNFSNRVKEGLKVDCAVIERAGESAAAVEKEDLSGFGALGNSFFAKTDVESALQRLGALIVIWRRNNMVGIPHSVI
jgi:hypothetical protein